MPLHTFSSTAVVVLASSVAAQTLHLVNCFPQAFGRPGVFSLKRHHGPELVLYDMRYISPVNRCGTAHLGGRAYSLLVFYACLLLFLVHFQGIAMMRTLKGGICQCIKYVERHLRVKCNYTDKGRGENMPQKLQWERRSHGSLFFSSITFYSFWQGRKRTVPLFLTLWILYEIVFLPYLFCLFGLCKMQTTRCYLWHVVNL